MYPITNQFYQINELLSIIFINHFFLLPFCSFFFTSFCYTGTIAASSRILLKRFIVVLAVTASVVDNYHAPPAKDATHILHFQMPTADLFTVDLPHLGQLYLALCLF